jgi:hypothetical protein
MKITSGYGPQIITPPSHKEILRLKEKLLDKLIAEIVAKAELEKGKREGVEGPLALSKAEWREIAEKTHAELEARGWFDSGAGIR